MDDSKATAIVSALANGVNPLTGEIFPASSPYQAPEIVRALHTAVRALESGRQSRPPQRSEALGNVGKPWSKDEDQRLLAEFDRGRPLPELAQAHARTLAGIEARLEKHGRLTPQQRVTSNRYTPNRDESNGQGTKHVQR
jgi:hypothetical protein